MEFNMSESIERKPTAQEIFQNYKGDFEKMKVEALKRVEGADEYEPTLAALTLLELNNRESNS